MNSTAPSGAALPDRKKYPALGIIAVVLMLLFGSNAEARRKSSQHGGEVRARLIGLWGKIDYSSVSPATNGITAFNGNQFGGRGELELWLGRRFGLLIEGGTMMVDVGDKVEAFRGQKVSQDFAALKLGYRLFGGGSPFKNELVFFVGPSVRYFSEIRGYIGRNFFDRLRKSVLGAELGARGRIVFSKTWAAELGGFWFHPYSLLESGGKSKLAASGTRSYGVVASIEQKLYEGLSLGVGVNYENNRMTYAESARAQVVEFNMLTSMLFIRLWF